MTLLDLSHRAESLAPDNPARRAAARAAVAVVAIVLLMAFVDGPLAAVLVDLPEAFVARVATVSENIKGVYLIAAAFAVAIGAMLATLLTRGRRKVALRSISVGASYVFVASLLALAVATALKVVIGRARPELLALEGPHAFFPFSTEKAFTSFPSGETMMAAAFFGACARLALPRLGFAGAALIFAPALALAAARLVVGAHYLSDIVAGLLLSLVIVAALHNAVEQRIAGRMASHEAAD